MNETNRSMGLTSTSKSSCYLHFSSKRIRKPDFKGRRKKSKKSKVNDRKSNLDVHEITVESKDTVSRRLTPGSDCKPTGQRLTRFSSKKISK